MIVEEGEITIRRNEGYNSFSLQEGKQERDAVCVSVEGVRLCVHTHGCVRAVAACCVHTTVLVRSMRESPPISCNYMPTHMQTRHTHLPSLVAHTGVEADILHDARVGKAERQVRHATETASAGDLQRWGRKCVWG